jgi:hypothetical protein
MPELSLYNIDQISLDIGRAEISFSHLPADLIDHICCDVEYEMQNGMTFSEAYQRVKQKMGPRRLKEIQEETLYLVDTKYRKMKNTMKFSGVAGTIMFGVAAMFKIQHWPFAGIMFTLGALILAFVFLPSTLSVLWKESHNRSRLFLFISGFLAGMLFIFGTLWKVQHWPGAGIILSLATLSGILFFIPALTLSRISQENSSKRPVYIIGAAGIIFYALGLLFKIQHWPLATILMVLGLIALSAIAFPWYTWLTWKEENQVSHRFIFLVIGSLLIMVPGALINLNLQHSYQAFFYPNNYQQNALCNYLLMNNNSLVKRYHDSLAYPEMERLHSRTEGMLAIISNIQEKMVQVSEGEPGKPAVSAGQLIQTKAGQEILYWELSRPFDTQPAKDFLVPGSSTRKELNSSMAEYITYLTGITSAGDVSKYKKMLETETYLPMGRPEDGDLSLLSGLHSLEIMKNGLLTVESFVLNEIARHK